MFSTHYRKHNKQNIEALKWQIHVFSSGTNETKQIVLIAKEFGKKTCNGK